MTDTPWIVMKRSDLDAILDRAVERGRELHRALGGGEPTT